MKIEIDVEQKHQPGTTKLPMTFEAIGTGWVRISVADMIFEADLREFQNATSAVLWGIGE